MAGRARSGPPSRRGRAMTARLRRYPTGPAGVPEAAVDAAAGLVTEPGQIMVDTFVEPMLPAAGHADRVALVGAPLTSGRWWWATRDWSTFVQGAEASMPSTPYLTPDAAPCPTGSIWLADPFRFTASDGVRQTVDVIAWRLMRFTAVSVLPAALLVTGVKSPCRDNDRGSTRRRRRPRPAHSAEGSTTPAPPPTSPSAGPPSPPTSPSPTPPPSPTRPSGSPRPRSPPSGGTPSAGSPPASGRPSRRWTSSSSTRSTPC